MSLSVVLPHRNMPHWLQRCWRLLDEQFYPPDEVIILDNRSEKYKRETVSHYCRNKQTLTWVFNSRDLGYAESVNRGFRIAQTEWVSLISCDDSFDKFYLNTLMQHAKAGVAFVTTNAVKPLGPDIVAHNYLCGPCLYHRQTFLDMGGYRVPAEGCEGLVDWDFWIRAWKAGLQGVCLPENLYVWTQRPDSLSKFPSNEAYLEAKRKVWAANDLTGNL